MEELLDVLKFLVEYLILYPVAFDLLNEFLYQILRSLPFPKLLSWIQDKSHKLAVSVQVREEIIRQDLSYLQQAIASTILTHRCIHAETQVPVVTSRGQDTCITGNLSNQHQSIDSTALTYCFSVKEIQEVLHTLLTSPHLHAVDSSEERKKCENDSSIPNSGIAQPRINFNLPFTNFTLGCKSPSVGHLSNAAGVLDAERTQIKKPYTLSLNSFISDKELPPACQLDVSSMESDSKETLLKTQSTFSFSSFSSGSESISTGQLNIPTIKSDSGKTFLKSQPSLLINSVSELIPENLSKSAPKLQNVLGYTINSVEYEHPATNGADDYNLQVSLGHVSKKLRSYQEYKHRIRQMDTNPMRQTRSTDMMNISSETLPADRPSMVSVVSSFEKHSLDTKGNEVSKPTTAEDSKLEDAVFFSVGSSQVYSADERSERTIPMEQTPLFSSVKLSRQKVRRTRSLGNSPSPKRRCCHIHWYGDRYRRRCEEQIPEVVQRYSRPANFVISHFSSTLEETQAVTSRNSFPVSRNSAPTSRRSSPNLENAVSISSQSAPASTNSFASAVNSDSTFLPHLYL